jgi:hypothetical protein
MISLNLLPPEHRRLYAQSLILDRWKGGLLVITIGCICLNAVLFGGIIILRQRASSASAHVTELTKQIDQSDVGPIKRDIQTLDQTLSRLRQIIPAGRSWSKEIASVVVSLPTGITLSEVIWTTQGDITLRGIANVRADFIALDAKLKTHPLLENIQTQSQASRRDTLPFEYTAHLKTI